MANGLTGSEEVALDREANGVPPTPAPPPAPSDKAAGAPGKRPKGSSLWDEIKGIFWLVLAVLGFHSFIAKPFYIPSESMLPGLLVGDRLVVTKYPYGWSYVSPTFHLLPFIHGRLFGSLPERGDVVIVTPTGSREDYIKRVIGLPGETIQVRGGTVYLNDVPVKRGPIHSQLVPIDANTRCDPVDYPGLREEGAEGRPYCRLPLVTETLPNGRHYETVELGYSPGDDYPRTLIPAGHVFVMGDNRDRSADSRFPLEAQGLGGPVPWENIGGRAEFLTFSLDGNASWNPLSWWTSLRPDRAGTSLHAPGQTR